MEGSLVLDELLGDGLEDAAGLGAGLGELVEGKLALEFDGVTGRRGLVPGHGGTLKKRVRGRIEGGEGEKVFKIAKKKGAGCARWKKIFGREAKKKILTHARCFGDPMP